MTISQKGLLPQLVDVLHALTDSQELLSHRIRRAHLELLASQVPDVEGLGPAVSFELPKPHQTFLSPPSQAHSPDPSESFSTGTSASSIPSSESSPAHFMSIPRTEPRSVDFGQGEATTPAQTSTGGVSSIAGTDAAETVLPNRPRNADATGRDAINAEIGTRDYNFFDELDARLADLRSSQNGSDDEP